MDGTTLSKAMLGILSISRYNELAKPVSTALAQADCTTVNRAAMFLAQIGHESMGLRYMEEIASGSAYEGRKDLGNTQAGDGKRFKGRGPIQITGRHNYTQVSKWAHSRGLVPSDDYFVKNPEQMASLEHGFIGAVWYWTAARNMNSYADKADIVGATRAVNGGLNGLDDRRNRWNVCKGLGKALLAGAPTLKPPATSTTTPVYPTKGSIHTKFGQWGKWWSWNKKGDQGQHGGDDWHDGPNSTGNPIYAVANGRVIYAGNGKDGLGWGPAFGNHVLIQWDEGGRTSIDAHMVRIAAKYGQQVKPGDIIGYLGQTGNVTGPHDHHEQHLGTGWGDKRVKPIYPGRQTTTTPATPGKVSLLMSSNIKKWASAKKRTIKPGKWVTLELTDKGATSMLSGPASLFAHTWLAAKVPAGATLLIRYATVNYSTTKPRKKTTIQTPYTPCEEVLPSSGLSYGSGVLLDSIGKAEKGWSRRLRVQVYATSKPVELNRYYIRLTAD